MADLTNLEAEIAAKIAALVGTETIKELLILRESCDNTAVDTTALDAAIQVKVDSFSGAELRELLMANRALIPYANGSGGGGTIIAGESSRIATIPVKAGEPVSAGDAAVLNTASSELISLNYEDRIFREFGNKGAALGPSNIVKGLCFTLGANDRFMVIVRGEYLAVASVTHVLYVFIKDTVTGDTSERTISIQSQSSIKNYYLGEAYAKTIDQNKVGFLHMPTSVSYTYITPIVFHNSNDTLAGILINGSFDANRVITRTTANMTYKTLGLADNYNIEFGSDGTLFYFAEDSASSNNIIICSFTTSYLLAPSNYFVHTISVNSVPRGARSMVVTPNNNILILDYTGVLHLFEYTGATFTFKASQTPANAIPYYTQFVKTSNGIRVFGRNSTIDGDTLHYKVSLDEVSWSITVTEETLIPRAAFNFLSDEYNLYLSSYRAYAQDDKGILFYNNYRSAGQLFHTVYIPIVAGELDIVNSRFGSPFLIPRQAMFCLTSDSFVSGMADFYADRGNVCLFTEKDRLFVAAGSPDHQVPTASIGRVLGVSGGVATVELSQTYSAVSNFLGILAGQKLGDYYALNADILLTKKNLFHSGISAHAWSAGVDEPYILTAMNLDNGLYMSNDIYTYFDSDEPYKATQSPYINHSAQGNVIVDGVFVISGSVFTNGAPTSVDIDCALYSSLEIYVTLGGAFYSMEDYDYA